MRFIGRREGVAPELLEQMRWAEETTGRQRPHHAVRGLQLRRPGGDHRRRASASRARPRRSSARYLYAPEMHDPDLIIRTSGEQRLSNYLLWQSAYSRAALHRGAVAGLLARRPRGRARPSSTRASGASGAADGSPASRRARRSRRATRLRPGARILVAIPAIAFAIIIIVRGRLDVRARRCSRSASSACTSCSAMLRARAAGAAGRLPRRWPGWSWPPRSGDEQQVLLALVGVLSRDVPARGGDARSASGSPLTPRWR